MLASSISALINVALNLIVIAIFMVVSGVDLSWSAILTPFYILELFLFGIGIAFILSAVFVRLRDMNYIWEIILQALFYGSAVMYPIAIVIEQAGESMAKILLINPVTQAIQDTRHALIDPINPTLYSLSGDILLSFAPILIVVIVVVSGAWFFKKRSPHFAEEV